MIDDNCTWLLPTPSLSQAFRRQGDSKFILWLSMHLCVWGKCVPHMCLRGTLMRWPNSYSLGFTRESWTYVCLYIVHVQVTVTWSALPPFPWWNWRMSFSRAVRPTGWCRAGWDFSSSSQKHKPIIQFRESSVYKKLWNVFDFWKKASKFLLRFNNPLNEA